MPDHLRWSEERRGMSDLSGSSPSDGEGDPQETPEESLNDQMALLAEDYQAAMTPTRESFAAFDVSQAVPLVPHREPDAETPSADGYAEFDERVKDPFMGLMFVGALTKRFDWAGHTFVIRTLTVDDQLQCSVVSKDYVDTGGANRAWQSSVVASCIESVDGQPLPVPIDDSKSGFLSRYTWVTRHWFPPVIDVVYEQYLTLQFKVQEVLAAMGKAQG